MPAREPDPEDPLLLQGVFLPEDTEEEMAEAFVEEYVKIGYRDEVLLKIFQNPHFAAANAIWKRRGEPYVADLIRRVRSQWGQIRYRWTDPEVNHA